MTDTIDVVAASRCRRSRRHWWISSSSPSVCWRRRRSKGVELVGPGGLLNQLTKRVLETAWRRR